MQSLSETIEAATAGRNGAWAVLVARFAPSAHRLARALLGDASLAEDAVQDAFLIAMSRLSGLRQPEAFPAWFRQVVRTAAARIRRRRADPLFGGLDPAGSVESPEEDAARREIAALVRTAVSTLPPAAREAVELFYFQGRPVADVAATLGVPRGTVRRRLFDARARLVSLWIGNPGAFGRKEDER